MLSIVYCPNGHRWEVPTKGPDSPAACPVCGAAAQPPLGGEAPDPDGDAATLQLGVGPSPKPPTLPRDEAATLPPPGGWPRGAVTPNLSSSSALYALRVVVPGYEILSELGRGGMGVVYKARHVKLNRLVALKMILSGAHAGEQDLIRFRTEAEAIARLQHPNIIQVYEVGEHEGMPYFALEFCPGGSLDGKLDGTPLPAREAAALVEVLARAMDAAHQQGIVHRDLKPGNILLLGSAEGRTAGGKTAPSTPGPRPSGLGALVPKITDFGLAKKLDEEGLTASGSIMGTPSYMSPEQADGKKGQIGPAADVYALGAILYELLTGRPPFRAATPLDTILQVINEEPVPPRRLQPKLPRDLETICLKCLHKQPARRYGSARELADDLHRFLAGEPIHGRPVGRLERAVKWARRRPAAAALLALTILAVVGGAAGGLWFTAKLRGERDRAEKARELAEAEKLRVESVAAYLYTSSGLMAADQGHPAQAALWFACAVGRAPHNEKQATANRQRFFLWTRDLPVTVRAMTEGGTDGIAHFLPHPDGKFLLLDRPDTGWRLWDLDAERPLTLPDLGGRLTAAAWSPDGRRVALGTDHGRCLICSFPGLSPVQTLELGGTVSELMFSPNGRLLVLGGRSLRVWDVLAGRFHTPSFALPSQVKGLAFGPSGRRLAAACSDDQARVFHLPRADRPGPLRLAFAPVPNAPLTANARSYLVPVWVNGGRALLTYGGKGDLLRWDAATGAGGGAIHTTLRGVDGVAVQPGGRLLAVYGWGENAEGDVKLFEATTGTSVGGPLRHKLRVACAVFSPDGQRLLTGCCDRTVRQWSVPKGKLLGPPLPHTGEVWGLALVPGGLITSTGRGDGTTRVWRFPKARSPNLDISVPESGRCDRTLLSPDGRHLVSRPEPKTARVLDAVTGKPVGPVLPLNEDFRSCAFAVGGERLLTLTPKTLQGWDWRTGKAAFPPVALPAEAYSVTVSPDGSRAVVMCATRGLVVDTSSGKVLFEVAPKVPAKPVWYHPRVRFRPDGLTFVTYCWPDVAVWDTATGKRHGPLLANGGITFDARYSADGKLLATGSADAYVRVWRADTGEKLAELKQTDWVYGVGFSSDGQYLVTAGRDGEARVWDWKAGKPVGSAMTHRKEVRAALFLPGDALVFTASADGTARVWEVRTGKPLTPALPLPIGGERAELTPDGGRVLVDVPKGSARVFDLKTLLDGDSDLAGLDPAALRLLGEVNAAQTIDKGGVVNLIPEEWLDRWWRLRKAWPNLHPLPGTPR